MEQDKLITIDNEEELQKFAEGVIKNLEPHRDRAFMVGLSGELGSGKTTFTQKIAPLYGIKEKVTSPTFVLEKIYTLDNQIFKKLIHIDAYRLENDQELKALGWDELVQDSRNIIFIEWPERIKKILSQIDILIAFKYVDQTKREITLAYGGK